MPVLALAQGGVAPAAELKKHTLQAFDAYIRTVENQLDERLRKGDFLWCDDNPARLAQVRAGAVVIQPSKGKGEIEVRDGLIHDWVGAVFIKGATLKKVLAAVQNYDNHKNTHKPEVLDSRLISRNGNDFKIYLRVMKKKVITAVLNTEHDVHYYPVSATREHSRSYSTRIAEVENHGEKNEREKPVDTGHGFLWRLYSYWRFQEKDGGVYIECQAISLTRDIPFGFGWVAMPIVRDLPRESLENTLRATRNALNKQEVGGVRALR